MALSMNSPNLNQHRIFSAKITSTEYQPLGEKMNLQILIVQNSINEQAEWELSGQ